MRSTCSAVRSCASRKDRADRAVVDSAGAVEPDRRRRSPMICESRNRAIRSGSAGAGLAAACAEHSARDQLRTASTATRKRARHRADHRQAEHLHDVLGGAHAAVDHFQQHARLPAPAARRRRPPASCSARSSATTASPARWPGSAMRCWSAWSGFRDWSGSGARAPRRRRAARSRRRAAAMASSSRGLLHAQQLDALRLERATDLGLALAIDLVADADAAGHAARFGLDAPAQLRSMLALASTTCGWLSPSREFSSCSRASSARRVRLQSATRASSFNTSCIWSPDRAPAPGGCRIGGQGLHRHDLRGQLVQPRRFRRRGARRRR